MRHKWPLIGNAMELIQLGKQKIIFAGGSDEVHFAMTAMFDAMTALSSKYNDNPTTALGHTTRVAMDLLFQVVAVY